MTNCTGEGGETEHRVTGAGALITKEVTGDRKEVMEFRITRGNGQCLNTLNLFTPIQL